jgi:hypothetical protein
MSRAMGPDMQDIELRFEEDNSGNLMVVFERKLEPRLATSELVLVDEGESFAVRWIEPTALASAA